MDYTQQQSRCLSDLQNISEQERTYSLIGAGALLLSGLRHLSVGRMAIGGYLAYRGATGHCPIREGLERAGMMGGCSQSGMMSGGMSRSQDMSYGGRSASGQPHEDLWRGQRPRDEVEEASMESFPASDPPNYSRGGNA